MIDSVAMPTEGQIAHDSMRITVTLIWLVSNRTDWILESKARFKSQNDDNISQLDNGLLLHICVCLFFYVMQFIQAISILQENIIQSFSPLT